MSHPNSPKIICEEMKIPSNTPGIELFVRNKRRADLTSSTAENTLLFVAGSTYPASTSFDLRLDGVSWMEQLAASGYNTYLVDVRGYGRSDRPPEMSLPASDNGPVVRTPVAVSDIATTVQFILSRIGADKINLIGWSWGAALMAIYTSTHNQAVNKLVLVAPQWVRDTPSKADGGGALGAYRVVPRSGAKARWLNGAPEDKREELLPDAWFEAWADATFTSVPGGDVSSAHLLAPNGTVLDSRECWAAGKPLYNPADIRVPVLIVHADWDADCPLDMSCAVFTKLTAAPYRRWIEIGEGTHSAFMEKNRWQIFGSVQAFLDEKSPSR
ncbi:alpha/beta hydrolase [Collimonas sp.]|uniref:alpha/beta hydrolase n=1 Tax=Collimonas sp. TaxID=1963772 RepID=UPI002C3BF738|nr:alpha/beta fold hydrolase [Collimonas sp.]HWX02265.1 alpha/beta fold hydrolase [Collimonas sp.]